MRESFPGTWYALISWGPHPAVAGNPAITQGLEKIPLEGVTTREQAIKRSKEIHAQNVKNFGTHTVGDVSYPTVRVVYAEEVDDSVLDDTTSPFITPLQDSDIPDAVKQHVPAWRALAQELNYQGPVAYRVRAGFTLKEHAPLIGPCYEDFTYLQDWNFKNDEPTEDSIVFWIPRILPESRKKTVKEQLDLLTSYRTRHHLPPHHLTSFGGAALLSALILSHHKNTGETVPENNNFTRTDTLLAAGCRLFLGGFDASLYCNDWDWDVNRLDSLGCFLLGVETLGH